MAIAEHERMSADAFLDWVIHQEGRYELVDGLIVTMMAGAKQAHNVVVSNIVIALGPQAKRHGCRTTSSDTAVRTASSGIRYPDIVVECGPPQPDAREAIRPVLVAEVSSPSTTEIDATDKLDEYRAHDDIQLILLVEPDVVLVKLYRRSAGSNWAIERYDDLSEAIDLPEIGATLTLAEIYDTLTPRARGLRLVDRA